VVANIDSNGNLGLDGKIEANVIEDFYIRDDRFPCKMTLIRNEQMDNTLDIHSGIAEELNETDFATHAKWDTTGVGSDLGGNLSFIFGGGTLNGTGAQTAVNRVSTGTNSAAYQFTYTVAVALAPDGDFALTLDDFPAASTTLAFTAGTHTVRFMSAADATAQPLTITATESTSTQGSITIDDVTLKRCKEIFVTAINTGTNSVTLSWIPYIESLVSPTTNYEWGLLNLETMSGGADPDVDGDIVEAFSLDSGTYSTRVFTYTDARGAEGNWTVGDRVALINPYEGNFDWPSANPIISKSGAGWRATYVAAGGCFHHSDGSLVLLVSGNDGAYEIGAFKSDGTDWTSWSVLNSDSPIFTASGNSDWYHAQIFAGGSVFKLPNEDRFIAYVSGYTGTKWKIGWIKFDEDFSAGSIEYAPDEIIDSSGATNGLVAPSVIYYAGKYRMAYTDRNDNSSPVNSTNPWKSKEAFSNTPEGTFTYSADICSGRTGNAGSWREGWTDNHCYFMWKGKLCLIMGGTSRYSTSGTRANRVNGLWYWDEKLATPAWVEDKRNPIWTGLLYGSDLWAGIDDWAEDHLGGYWCMAINPTNGKLYVFFTAKNTDYAIGIMTMDMQNLYPHH